MIGRVCWRFAEVDSTQSVAFNLAELGADHGTVVRADFQSAGRGRQGKVWESARGSALMFSVILRPAFPLHELGGISILVAYALADALAGLIDSPIQIKWPNDVLIGGRKTSGILLQTRSGPKPVAVLGIGINIDESGSSLPNSSTSLNQHTIQPITSDGVLTAIARQLNEMWDSYEPGLTEKQIDKLESRLWQIGKMVSILDADREVHGIILGLAKNGGLRLSVEGSERVVVAGEILRGPRAIEAPEMN